MIFSHGAVTGFRNSLALFSQSNALATSKYYTIFEPRLKELEANQSVNQL